MNGLNLIDDDDGLSQTITTARVYKTSAGPYPPFARMPVFGVATNSALTQIALDLHNSKKHSLYLEVRVAHSDIDAAYGITTDPSPSVLTVLADYKSMFPPELFRVKKGARKTKGVIVKKAPELEEDDGAMKPKLEPEEGEDGEEEGEEQEDDPLLELEAEESDSDNDYTTNYDDDEPPDELEDDNEDAI